MCFKYSLHSYSWMSFTDDVTLSVNFVDERLLIQGMRSFNLLPLAEKKKLMF